jgi:tight adherence protein C
MAGLELAFALCLFVGAAYFLFQNAGPNARKRRAAVDMVRRWSPGLRIRKPGRSSLPSWARLAHALEPIGRRFGSQKRAQALRYRIGAAGLGGKLTAEGFTALRLVGTVCSGVFAIVIVTSTGPKAMLSLLLLMLPVFFWVLPGTMLDRMAAGRRERIAAALPDALDLLAVTVEAGLGLYGAIARLVETSTGPLANEFGLVLTELRVGQSSEKALRGMAQRVDTPEVTSFVRSLIQGEKLGLSLASTLRNLANDARRRRRAVAEERAAKAPVKMLFPTALFIFPALFIILLGPALIVLKHAFA